MFKFIFAFLIFQKSPKYSHVHSSTYLNLIRFGKILSIKIPMNILSCSCRVFFFPSADLNTSTCRFLLINWCLFTLNEHTNTHFSSLMQLDLNSNRINFNELSAEIKEYSIISSKYSSSSSIKLVNELQT